MKDITVSVDEKTYQALEKEAARKGLRVGDLVCNSLRQLALSAEVQDPVTSPASAEEFERLRQLRKKILAKIEASGVQFRAADRLSRDELYNRDAFR
jgi:hypothetical protein